MNYDEMIYMGKKRMKCSNCGTENINDMLVEFIFESPNQDIKKGVDTTTIPKFLYYLEHPQSYEKEKRKIVFDKEITGAKILQVNKYICEKCFKKIKSTRFGI